MVDSHVPIRWGRAFRPGLPVLTVLPELLREDLNGTG